MRVDRALSTLLIAVPEAEPVVGAHRLRLDPSARAGVPAHVTVLFPFVPADALDGSILGRLATMIGGVHAFGYRFSRTSWCDERVVYLAPDDDAPFRALTHRGHAEFPAYLPFEGAFDDVVSHLTIGQDQPLDVLRRAEDDVRCHLPVEGHATEVVLLVQDEPGGRWRPETGFPLSRR